MSKAVKRGSSPGDGREFAGEALDMMKKAAQDMFFLLSRGYPSAGAGAYVGDHYQLSARQRTALMRTVSAKDSVDARLAKKRRTGDLKGETVHIDGFNAIITLEVALSGSPVLRCMDTSFRDLAGLRGTYRLIDRTDAAVRMILSELIRLSVKRAVFYLDAPVSNSGRLKARIAEIAEEEKFDAGVEVTGNADRMLFGLENVISSDSVVIDRCKSWINLNEGMIPGIPGVWVVELMK